MKRIYLFLFIGLPLAFGYSQNTLKPHLAEAPAGIHTTDLSQIVLQSPDLTGVPRANRNLFTQRAVHYQSWPAQVLPHEANLGLKLIRDPENGQLIAAQGRAHSIPNASQARADREDAKAYLRTLSNALGIADTDADLELISLETSAQGYTHAKFRQQHQGIPVYGAELYLHAAPNRAFEKMRGRVWPDPQIDTYQASLTPEAAQRLGVDVIEMETPFLQLSAEQQKWISGPQSESELVLYPFGNDVRLAWQVELRPNISQHYTYLIDAHSGAILNTYAHRCGFSGEMTAKALEQEAFAKKTPTPFILPPDGPATASGQDLNNSFKTINTYSLDDLFYLLDGSRNMFGIDNNELSGYILTYDGKNGSPELESFEPEPSTSFSNNDWTATEISAHHNAGVAYAYYEDQLSRNSINGIGGDILSIINVAEADGSSVGNAFWNGIAMFYGNGDNAFFPLAGGLDVAGHEMTHGVIQAEADLIYQEQPGAINESFADIFGYLIENESGDYRIGEDVVKSNFFPSGALRNLANPNNGGSGPGDFRWQPAHMDEYQDLPVNSDNDQGGVHINSGIPNKAFHLFSTSPGIGDQKAAEIYYLALAEYLTRSSRFIDLRIAVEDAAVEEYGVGSAELQAVSAAFTAVGIGEGEGGDYQQDLDSNPGDPFLMLSNTGQTALFLGTEGGTLLENPLLSVSHRSKPSITDDGSIAVFVDSDNHLRIYNLATEQINFLETTPQPIWRNIVISKDGARIAAITDDLNPDVLVFDFGIQSQLVFELFNPTTATGIQTGEVQYADAMEWDPSGEVLMFDVLSRFTDPFGLETDVWDIGFLNAWNTAANTFADGSIVKLYSNLPEGVDIGNPAFAKNSPFVITYDRLDGNTNSLFLISQNIETGDGNTIFNNLVISYPAFGVDDDRIFFDAQNTDGEDIIASIPLGPDKITITGGASPIFLGGHWAVPFADGERVLTDIDELSETNAIQVFPNPFEDRIQLQWSNAINGPVHLEILDASGRIVYRSQIGASLSTEIQVPDLASGMYWLIARQGGQRWVKVIIRD